MQSPYDERKERRPSQALAKTADNDVFLQQRSEHYFFLTVMASMAIAIVAILLWTLSQTAELAKSSRTSDLQYIANIQNELTHVMLLARKVADDSAPPSGLQETLAKLVIAFEGDPRVSANFGEQLPDTEKKSWKT